MPTIIKSGTLITASETYEADILIDGEKIVSVGENIDISSSQIIDAAGKLVMPGGIDPHTHLDLPMFDTVSSDDLGQTTATHCITLPDHASQEYEKLE